MAAREPVGWTLPDQLQLVWNTPTSLYYNTLGVLLQHDIIKDMDAAAVKAHLQQPSQGGGNGGEAEVHIARWYGTGGGKARDGQLVAVKVYRITDRCGGFKRVMNDDDACALGHFGQHSLQKEVHILAILHHSGFADRVPEVLGVVQHWGDMYDPPLHGYAMRAYRYGSLAGLMRDTCERREPESVFAGFFSPRRMTGEYSALMEALSRLHAGERGIMLQDLSSNNLLVQDQVDGSCRLLLADPSMSFLISDLKNVQRRLLVSTWLWGALATRHKRFDPTADNYSLSMCFLEVWLCSEGAPMTLFDLMQSTRADLNLSQGHTFARELCVAVLRRHASGSGTIAPRIQRELPVSWLTLWLLLLGTEDYASLEQLESGQAHRRPAEADMVDAAAQLAAVTADVEELGGLTAEALATPGGEALVARCLQLHERLTALSQLKPPKGSSLAPLDPSLSWVATRFMAQEHPLVAAMRAAQGAAPLTSKTALQHIPPRLRTFRHAVEDAQAAAGCDPYNHFYEKRQAIAARDEAAAEGETAKQMLGHMCKEYGRLRDLALELLPSHPDRGQLLEIGHLDPYLQERINTLCPPSGTWVSPDAAAAQPPAAEPPACQPLHPAGPPPAHPPAAGQHSGPQLHAAQRSLNAPLLHAAPMPALPSSAPRPAPAAALPVELPPVAAGLMGAGMPPAQGAAAAPPGPAATYSDIPSSGTASGAAAAAAAAAPLPASLPPQPALCSPAQFPVPSTGHLPGPSSAAAAVPWSPAASPPPIFLQQLPTLPAASGDATSPSANLSSRTVAGGPGDASPATSGAGGGVSSPNKRKRGAEQPDLAPGATLRFAVSRNAVAGLPAFRLPPHTGGSNLYAYMVAQLSEDFREDVHQLLAQKQGPYAALLAAAALQPAELDSLVQMVPEGRYIEVSAASFLPKCNAGDHTTAAPIIFHTTGRGLRSSEQQIECGGGSTDERAAYSTALRSHFQKCKAEGLMLAYGGGASTTILFRIAAAQLPQGRADMPWVQHQWTVPAADLGGMTERAAHLFRKKQ